MCKHIINNPLNFQNKKNGMEDMLEKKYSSLETCGVFYLELNHLDELEVIYGKKEGEKFFTEVTESIHQLQSDEVHIYSCGMHGFLIIGLNYSKEQIRNMAGTWIKKWEEPLYHKSIKNIFSIGIAWDSAPISFKGLMVKAIEEMLHNKKLMEDGMPMSYCVHGEITTSFGLATRKQFFKNVDYKLKNSCENYCIIAIDIEHFKLFNKWYGRSAGDELLASFAGILKEFEKNYDGIAAYIGADDFAIFLPDQPEIIASLEKRFIQAVMGKVKTAGFLPAFGVYRIENRNMDAVDMFDYAVEALSQALGHYDKRTCYYEKRMTASMEKEIDVIVAAREALKKGEFVIYLQPQVRIETSKIVGAEALLRWISPEKGMIPPGELIPILEKNGFIGEVDQFVWELACKTIRSWLDKGIEPIPISINVSRIDILSFDVVGYINNLAEKYQIDHKYLKIEITESAYTENISKITDAMKELREYSYTLMMDDFGSGYSSLNMLGEIVIDIIKLDMRFLDAENKGIEKGVSVLKSVIDMSNGIKTPIVMEGVETKQQENFLQDMGVRFAQGYLYYKPMPAEQLEELIKDEKNVDRRGIYNKDIDIINLNKAIQKMQKNRSKRYEKIDITKTRGGFFEYESDGNQKLIDVSQSVVYMYGCDTVEEFREFVGNSFIGMVHPQDRRRVQAEINDQICSSEWKMDYIEYRIIRKNGEVRYVYDYGHLEESKEDGKSRFYVFLLDITDRIK